ncbi:MAG TPA: hypothetical protein VNM92_11720 [Thermoanaerobaculia bacterium]|nr:hypothetical protein [Thermoanaerobaculia bacterium]
MSNEAHNALRRAYEQWKLGKFPRAGELDVEGANVDLAHDDSHVAGLCARFLESGSIDPHLVIQLNSSIEERLAKAARRYPDAAAEIEALRAYRDKVANLAGLLSKAASVPVVGLD